MFLEGYVHEASSTDKYSLHITLGIITNSYAHLLRAALEDIEEDSFFRSSLPKNINIDDLSNLNTFREYVSKYISEINWRNTLNQMQTKFVSSRLPDSTDRLKDYFHLDSITHESWLIRRKSIYYDFNVNEFRLKLRFNNKAIKLPLTALKDMEFILQSEKFQVEDLKGNLDNPGKITLCKMLVEEGFLTFLDHK